jgi:DNA-binding LacI/PurR family transcriptional regulator
VTLEGATIGVAVGWSSDYYSRPVLRGIEHALSAAGACAVALTGEEWSKTPRPRNSIYSLLDRRTFDGGIVLGGTLFHERDAAEHFGACHRELPLVSIGTELPGALSVMADNASGVREAVLHLAALGRRRIAFVRGPTGNSEAAERYRGYREGLQQAGLAVDPDLIAPGAFVLLSGSKAVELLLDERGVSPDAIVAANDESARGALEALQRRGVLVPDDVAVIGFDDVADAELCHPKLTTVAQPLVEQGVQAALQLGRLLAGEKPERRIDLETHVVYRDSCGGRDRVATPCPKLDPLLAAGPARAWVEASFPRLWPWLRRQSGWTSLDEPPVRDALSALLELDVTARRAGNPLESAVRRTAPGEAWRWIRGIEALATALGDAAEPSLRHGLATALARARAIVNEAVIADRVRENHQAALALEFAHKMSLHLLVAPGRAQMLQTLRLNLQKHPAYSGCHLSLYDDANWSRLVMSSSLRDATLDKAVRFPTRTLLPLAAFPRQRGATMCAAVMSSGRPPPGALLIEAPLEEAVRVGRVADRIGAWLNAHSQQAEQTGLRAAPVDATPERIGNYPIRCRIGSGGMAVVYLAEARVAGIPRPVALKLLHPHLQGSWSEQFAEEARITAAIRHPNVVQLIELGEHQGGMFLVMEYVDGANLADVMERATGSGSGLPLRITGRLLADALAGLAAAHDVRDADGLPVNLVHRDVSLQNILVGRDGVTRITDFGIARGSSEGNTDTGTVKGKLRYMSPEQATASPIDRRSDVWSMGVVAWELLAGRRMYGAANDAEILRELLTQAPPSLTQVAAVPEILAATVAGALSRDPAQRFSSALEFRGALLGTFKPLGGVADSEEVAEYVRAQLSGAPVTTLARPTLRAGGL